MSDKIKKTDFAINIIPNINSKKFPENKAHKIKIIHSLNHVKEKERIKKLIEIYNTNNTTNYFYTEPNIILGKQPKGPRMNNKSELKPYSYVGPSDLFQTKRRDIPRQISKNINVNNVNKNDSSKSLISKTSETGSRNVGRKKTRKGTTLTSSTKVNYNNINNNTYKLIDDKSLQNIYSKIKERIDKNKKRNYSNLTQHKKLGHSIFYNSSKNFFNVVNKNLNFQEEVLKNHTLMNKTRNELQKYLANKIHRKKKELIMNTTDDIFMKMLKIKQKEKNKTITDKFGENSWNITLRNEMKNGIFDKVGFENVGNKYEPMYTFFSLQTETEFYNKPFYKQSRIKKIFVDKENIGKKLDLEVNGKNLLDVESKRETGFKGKKILYKDGEVDLLFYRKQNHLSTIPKEVKKSIFSEKIFVKNYGKEGD